MSSSNRVYDHRPLGHSHPPPSSSGGLPPGAGGPGPGGGGQPGGLPPLGLGPSSLISSSGPGGPGGGGGGILPHASRLNDLLEFVKVEFDNVAGETVGLRAQRDEYEAMINHHTNEINAMRAIAYDLERKYHDDKRLMQEENARLMEDNTRLRRELDSRSSSLAGGPSTRLPPMEVARPGSSSSGPPSVGHGPSNLFGAAMSLLPNNVDRERGEPRDYPSYPNGAPPGREEHSNKRPRPPGDEDERERHPVSKGKTPVKPSTPLGGNPFSSAAFSRPPSTPAPSIPPQPSSVPMPPPNSLAAASSHAASHSTSSNGRGAVSPPAQLGGVPPEPLKDENGKADKDFDPENVARDLKKEGSDWMTMFNPNVKRVLDIGLVHTLTHDSVVCCVKFSPDGKILATGSNRNTTLYDTRTGAKIGVFADESVGSKVDNYVRSTSFSPDGKFLATGSEDRIIRIWNVAQKRISKVFHGHKSEIYSLAFSPDGHKLVSGSGDKTARVWDMDSGALLFTLPVEDSPHPNEGAVDAGVTSVVMSPDGKFLAAGSLDTVVRIWDINTGQLLDKLKGHKDSVYSVAFSPDGKFLVSGSLDRTLKMWDMASLRAALAARPEGAPAKDPEVTKTMCMTTLHGHKDYVLSVDISPDGAWIVSGSKDRGVQFWDPVTAKAQFMLQGHKNSVISVAVAAVGGLVATGSGDWSARIWSYERLPGL